jgi:hypothetical protein
LRRSSIGVQRWNRKSAAVCEAARSHARAAFLFKSPSILIGIGKSGTTRLTESR